MKRHSLIQLILLLNSLENDSEEFPQTEESHQSIILKILYFEHVFMYKKT